MTTSGIEYEIRHSERATKPRIDVDLDGVTVVVPEQLALDPAVLVEEKEDWIRKQQQKMRELRSRIPDRHFEEGATFPFQGEPRTVTVRSVDTSRVSEKRFVLSREGVEKTGVKDELESLYREEAGRFIRTRVERYAEDLGVDYGTISVKNQKTLWGSCSPKRNLNFNWRIMMAPQAIAEYVILHELCHLRHPNHSEDFWNLLANYTENPRGKARWLRENAVELIFTEDDL